MIAVEHFGSGNLNSPFERGCQRLPNIPWVSKPPLSKERITLLAQDAIACGIRTSTISSTVLLRLHYCTVSVNLEISVMQRSKDAFVSSSCSLNSVLSIFVTRRSMISRTSLPRISVCSFVQEFEVVRVRLQLDSLTSGSRDHERFSPMPESRLFRLAAHPRLFLS